MTISCTWILILKEIWQGELRWVSWIPKMERVETLMQLSHKLGKLSSQLEVGRCAKTLKVSNDRCDYSSIILFSKMRQTLKSRQQVHSGFWFWLVLIFNLTSATVAGGFAVPKEAICIMWHHYKHKGGAASSLPGVGHIQREAVCRSCSLIWCIQITKPCLKWQVEAPCS